MRKPRGVIMLVDPEFKKLIKSQSAEQGQTIIDFTRRIGMKRVSLMQEMEAATVEKRKPFTFRL